MSRTRIIKGKLIEIIGKDYSIFSEVALFIMQRKL